MADALLVLKIITDAKDAAKGLDDAAESTSKWNSNMVKAGAAAGVAAGAVVAFGVSAAKAAADDARGQALLEQTMVNMLGTTAAAASGMEDWISATSRASGVADDALRPAMATLIESTKDATKSQDLMQQAMDISAATGADLGTVTDAVAKGYQGNTKALAKLVPGLDDSVVASKDFNTIMEELAFTTGGAAATAAETTAGKMQRMQLSMDETKESIGAALLPAFDALSNIMLTVANFAQDHATLFTILMGVILALAGAVMLYSVYQKLAAVASGIWTAAQWLLNTAFLASPITWIVLGVIALIAVIVLIATKTTWFQDIWNTVWSAVKGAIEAVWDWIKNNWPLLLAILTGPIGLAVLFITQHLDDITGAARAVWAYLSGTFSSIWDTIKSTATTALEAITKPIDAISKAFETVVGWIQKVIDWIGRIKVPDAVANFVGKIADVLPFGAAPPAAPSVAPRAGLLGTSSGASGGGGGGPTFIIQGAFDPVATAAQIRRILRDDDRRRAGVRIGFA